MNGGKNVVILVKGDLWISGKITVPTDSTLLFSVSGNIHVDSSVGEVSTLSTPDIQGWYSADGSFIVENKGTGIKDLRLNVAGSIVVNAGLSGGTFQNKRDLYEDDILCPTVSIQERPDFVLNAPGFLLNSRRIWREVAP
jgi:hypothetical protein